MPNPFSWAWARLLIVTPKILLAHAKHVRARDADELCASAGETNRIVANSASVILEIGCACFGGRATTAPIPNDQSAILETATVENRVAPFGNTIDTPRLLTL